jgi:hypothetical protein
LHNIDERASSENRQTLPRRDARIKAMNFLVYALPPAALAEIRALGRDHFGHDLRIFTADGPSGSPLRCCLRDATEGERVALISWQPLTEAPTSPYAEIGPVFIHADPCQGVPVSGSYPEGFRSRRQLMRSYRADGDMLDCEITDGSEAETTIEKLLADPAAAVVHSRNILAGCYMFAIRPAATGESTGE